MSLAVVIPVWGDDYRRFWPRAWADVVRQARTGADVSEVILVRPSGDRYPTREMLSAAFERETGTRPPVIRERPLADGERRVGLARNAGLEEVSAAQVAFIDVDNMTAPAVWANLTRARARHRHIGSAAVAIVSRLPDGTLAHSGNPAHSWQERECLGPRIPDQVTLWRLAIRGPILAPAAGAVHTTETLRACGGFGHGSGFVDVVLTIASLACAPGLYLPRVLGTLYEMRPGTTYGRLRPRSELLDTHAETERRLRGLLFRGRVRPSVAVAMPLIIRELRRRSSRLERVMPAEGWPLLFDGVNPDLVEPAVRHPWVKGAEEDEARMSRLLSAAP